MPMELRLIPSDLLDLREAQTLDVFLGERVDAVALRLGLGGLELDIRLLGNPGGGGRGCRLRALRARIGAMGVCPLRREINLGRPA